MSDSYLRLNRDSTHPTFIADTVVLSHKLPPTSDVTPSMYPQSFPDIYEKPISKEDNLRMLLDLNGGTCEVVTGVSVVYPTITAPGYAIKYAT